MSKVESGTGDAKKLALRIKTLEMQLRQSVTKKEHHEITSKLEKQVDLLERELGLAREENQKTIALNKQIAGVEGLISSLSKAVTAQGKSFDSIEDDTSTAGKALGTQGKTLEAIATKLAQGTVPSHIHLQSLSKIRELEEEKRGMVRRSDYAAVEARCEELSRQLGAMVPSADYSSLKEKFDALTRQMAEMVPASDFSSVKQRAEALEGAISSMVPRENLAYSEERVRELEARLAEHVPQSVYDELVARVVSLAEAVTGGDLQPEETRAEPQPEAEPEIQVQAVQSIQEAEVISAEVISAEVISAAEGVAPILEVAEVQPMAAAEPIAPEIVTAAEPIAPEIVTAAEPIAPEIVAAAEPIAPEIVTAAEPIAPENPVQEIREVQSQLAEINSQALEAQGADAAIATAIPAVAGPQTETPGFAFSSGVAVRTSEELVLALDKVASDVLESAVKSGDLEKWFADALFDATTAESLKKIREGGVFGDELRSQVASSLEKYLPAPNPAPQQAPTTT